MNRGRIRTSGDDSRYQQLNNDKGINGSKKTRTSFPIYKRGRCIICELGFQVTCRKANTVAISSESESESDIVTLAQKANAPPLLKPRGGILLDEDNDYEYLDDAKYMVSTFTI